METCGRIDVRSGVGAAQREPFLVVILDGSNNLSAQAVWIDDDDDSDRV